MGNRTYTRNLTDGLTDRSERYGYDNLNRLTLMDRGVLSIDGTTVETPLDHPVLNVSQQWADLDRRGNWLDYRWASVQGGQATTYQQTREANGVNEYPSIDPDGPDPEGGPPNAPPVALTYDDAGNLTLDPLAPNAGASAPAGQWYDYDEENRVTAVYRTNGTPEHGDDTLLAEYEYDALGRRVSSVEYIDAATGATLTTPRKTRHVYVGIETIEEYQITGQPPEETITLDREFLWGDPDEFPEPLAMVTHGGESGGQGGPGVPAGESVYHYLHDALGSVIGLTDLSGVLVERYTYDPYGRTLIENQSAVPIPQSAFGNPWLWTGQRYEPPTGLYAFLYRTYSSTLGRWLQRDPIGYAGGIDLYQYVMGSPFAWIDPLGLQPTSQPSSQPASQPTSSPDEETIDLGELGLTEAMDEAWNQTQTGEQKVEHGAVLEQGESGKTKVGPIRAGKNGEMPDEGLPRPGRWGSFHTHPNDTFISDADFNQLLRNSNLGSTHTFVVTSDCVYAARVVDQKKATDCAIAGAAEIQKMWQEALVACIVRKAGQDFRSLCGKADDPRTCEKEAGCAVAKRCGLKLYAGCGKDKNKPKPMPCP